MHAPDQPAYLTGDDAEAEREMRDYGGDAPLPKIPPSSSGRTRGTSFSELQQPHRAPDFRMPSGRRGSTSAVGGGRPGPAQRQSSRWSENGFPELHLVDTAYSEAHRQLSRMSRRRSDAAASEGTAVDNDSEQPQQREKKEKEEKEEDPNKVVWEENDPENPQNWSLGRKWLVTLLCAQATVVVTYASSAPSSAVRQVVAEFGYGEEVGQLMTALFLAGYCAGPLIWAVGRRPVFVVTLAVFALFQIGDAVAQNIWTIIIIRFFAATFASSPLTNPVLGPLTAGFLVDAYPNGWRWIFGVIGIWGACSWALVAIFLPETYHPVLLAKRAKRLRKEDPEKNADKYADLECADFDLKSILKRTVLRPAIMLAVEPIVLTVTIYLSVVYGILYGLFSVFPIVWGQLRGFNGGETGLIFLGVGIGTTIGAIISVFTQQHYRTLMPKWHGHPPPEERLWGSMLAGPLLIVGIFWLGWTGNYPSIHWAVPAGATILIGCSFTLIFVSFLSFLVEVYLMFSASALAANTVVRSAVAAAFPLFTSQMFAAMGVNWACSLLGFVALACAPAPFLFYKYGWRLRQKSQFAPCLDIGLREQVEREERERKEGCKTEQV
ncbi:hypothetical protein Rhopal_007395-T1 [Rhodotorula paludigena]|uniref:Major facilitator superfamily (MFS) profile domain-containing protein n=1 Tax=Rhodotorula paludigena TaxID=86838 RepID=A0AAV5GP05_9BASI|nr:hypothetical protein Rhopal_007395-T1 [Rhodotorula paludigena]